MIVSKRFNILPGTLCLIVFLLIGCANVSRIEKDSLIAFGELLDDAHEPLYYLIRIDVNKTADKRVLFSQVKLTQNAPALSLAELQSEFVSKFLPAFTPPPQWPDSWKQKTKEYDAYSGKGFLIKFNKKGQLLFVGICSHCEGKIEHPIVGTPNGNNFYDLPLTIRQFSEVFGLPTRIYKVNEVRY